MKKFGFYVSGNATTLKKFLKLYNDDNILLQIKIVISDNPEDKELEKILNLLGIEIFYFDSSVYDSEQRNIKLSNFILEKFVEFEVNLGFVFGGRILKGLLLKKYKNKLINFHPALLPSFKGIKAIDQALKENAFLLGNSAHIIVDNVDSGAVVMQNILHRSKFHDYSNVLDNQISMLYQIIVWFNQDRISINDDYVTIHDADYSISEYIPKLEI